jgi:hypothetical protein
MQSDLTVLAIRIQSDDLPELLVIGAHSVPYAEKLLAVGLNQFGRFALIRAKIAN